MKNILLMIFSIGLAANVFAQSVSGKVTDSDGMELPGVSILIKGTSTGTTTGIDGSYTISASSEDVLVFSFVGFETQEVAVGNRSTINVTLATDVKTLQEVVVIGYGEVDREDATGAISSVSSEDFNGGVITSPEQLFQGKAAGVQITSTSGEPGSGVNIRIRGTSSIRSNNNPLYVVDGVPLSGGNVSSGYGGPMGSMSAKNPLNFLNPNDIASIDILKDASATAIYGSRGANGVVLITTKKGKGGKGMLEYSYNLGISKVSNTYDLLSADEFVDAWSSYNPGVNPSTIDFGFDNDWQKEVFRTAYTSNHNLSFGDSSEKGSFRASIGYQDQQGVIQKSGLQRTTARFNSERKFMDDKLKITAQMTFSAIENQNVLVTNNSGFEGDLMGAVIKFNPTAPKYVDGSGNPTNTKGSDTSPFQLSNTEPSPIAILEYFDSYTNTY
ncbi:MAG: SusC/RagA family TonB-linked outer membrane protein, partial [Cyclobacteriaceae bacterium]|nr:SusC/RagA family TonB-linked outer membrane protein [Cyclobacteriaceae bacterium]